MSRRSKPSSRKSDRASAARQQGVDARAGGEDPSEIAALARRHWRFGWRSLLVFVVMGLFLESLHGFKVSWYLEIAHTTRRHMWTLAHAHGTLLAVLNLILAATIRFVPHWSRRQRNVASGCLISAAVLLPAGFFLGGCFTHEGDPGLGIALVPVGGVLLVIAVLLAARS